jgi:hypothetical protein
MEVRSVGNSQVLKDTALVEAFNLKAAIEFTMKNTDAAKEALTDMPPRGEEELDPVSFAVCVYCVFAMLALPLLRTGAYSRMHAAAIWVTPFAAVSFWS